MERKIGEEFDYNGVKLKVEKGDCNKECFFFDGCTRVKVYPVCGECVSYFRIDNEYVRFVRIENEIEMKEGTKIIEIPEGWEEDKVEDGKIVIKEKKKELPHETMNSIWIARDASGDLMSFANKPRRHQSWGCWVNGCESSGSIQKLSNNWFPQLTWNDEPIELVIKEAKELL